MVPDLPATITPPDAAAPPDRETRLAAALDVLLSDAAAGRPVDLAAVRREQPDLASELTELWATAELAGLFARPEPDPTPPALPTGLRPATVPTGFADYELRGELGRGGMGVVYRAFQHSLGRVVALKMVLRADLAGPAELARFRAEAEAAATLDHPHIVPIYEVGTAPAPAGDPSPPRPFFTMRLVEGTTLATRLIDGPLDPQATARLLVPVCRAIAFAHARGLVHRDLKPSNILIDTDGRPYVTDFGLVKRLDIGPRSEPRPVPEPRPSGSGIDSLTATGAILGTPSYMAPEQAAGRKDVGPAADIYALGAILYACLTGRPPFQGSGPAETLLMALDHDPVPPRLINPRADPDLELVARKCLQKPADLRYASATALADDLAAYLANEPLAARSGRFRDVLSRAFRETHHAAVLENWGLLWMLHAAALLALCAVTNVLKLGGVASRWPYLLLWTAGLGIWAAVFWTLRRRAGPVTFVERQIAHVWAGSMVCSTLLYLIEYLLGLPVLTLAPVLGLVSGMVFLMKASLLSGSFYLQAVASFATAAAMACWPYYHAPDLGILTFGVVAAACFFFPGLKYWRQTRNRNHP